MEIQLQELIDKIKKDGVDEAEIKSKSIIDSAKRQAKKIVADAHEQADTILLNAKKDSERMVKSSEEAIRQAGRNLLISFRKSVEAELNTVIHKEVTQVYSSDKLGQIIESMIIKWTSNPETDDITVLLNEKELQLLEENLLAEIKAKMLGGVTLKTSENFDGGFRIAVNNGKAYYDYSAEAVTDMLSNYLSPRVAQLLKEAK